MTAHTVFQTLCFKSPLVAELAIIVRTMARVALFGLCDVDRANNCGKGNEQYCQCLLIEADELPIIISSDNGS